MRTIAIVAAVIISGGLAYTALLHFLPKPLGVPNSVAAGFTPLNGVTWTWCEDAGMGSIRWSAAEQRGLGFSLYPAEACSKNRGGVGRLFAWYGDGRARFPFNPAEHSMGGGQPCPFKVSIDERSGMVAVIERALGSTTDVYRQRSLLGARAALANLENSVLRTGSGGFSCVAFSTAPFLNSASVSP